MPRVTELLYLERDTSTPLPAAGLIQNAVVPPTSRRPGRALALAVMHAHLQASSGGPSRRPSNPSSARCCRRLTWAAWTCPSWKAPLARRHPGKPSRSGPVRGRAVATGAHPRQARSRGRAAHGRGSRPQCLGGDLPGIDPGRARPRPGSRRDRARAWSWRRTTFPGWS